MHVSVHCRVTPYANGHVFGGRAEMDAGISVLESHTLFAKGDLGAYRSVDAALRRSIPAFNKDVKDMQARLEDVAFKLRIPQRKPWQGMADNVAASLVLAQQQDKVGLHGCLGTISDDV